MVPHQTIDGHPFRSALQAWLGENEHASLDPRCQAKEVGEGLAPRFVDLRAESGGVSLEGIFEQFRDGALPWLHFRECHEGSPADAVETPSTFAPVADTAWWPAAQCTLGLMGAARIDPISYRSENDGELFVNLVAHGDTDPHQRKSRGSLRGHTDAAAFPFPEEEDPNSYSPSPLCVVLVGLRNPDKVKTRIAPVFEITRRLKQAEVNRLGNPHYNIARQPSFSADLLGENYALRGPIIRHTGPELRPQIRFRNSGITTDVASDSNLLTKITKVLVEEREEVFEDVVVGPGDVVFVNNRIALHGRDRVTSLETGKAAVGGQSRWLLRTYGYAESDRGFREHPRSHVMRP